MADEIAESPIKHLETRAAFYRRNAEQIKKDGQAQIDSGMALMKNAEAQEMLAVHFENAVTFLKKSKEPVDAGSQA